MEPRDEVEWNIVQCGEAEAWSDVACRGVEKCIGVRWSRGVI